MRAASGSRSSTSTACRRRVREMTVIASGTFGPDPGGPGNPTPAQVRYYHSAPLPSGFTHVTVDIVGAASTTWQGRMFLDPAHDPGYVDAFDPGERFIPTATGYGGPFTFDEPFLAGSTTGQVFTMRCISVGAGSTVSWTLNSPDTPVVGRRSWAQVVGD